MGSGGLQTVAFDAPKQVASKASLVHRGRRWVIACGGVQINPWQYVSANQPSLAGRQAKRNGFRKTANGGRTRACAFGGGTAA